MVFNNIKILKKKVQNGIPRYIYIRATCNYIPLCEEELKLLQECLSVCVCFVITSIYLAICALITKASLVAYMSCETTASSVLLFTLKPPDFMAIYCELSDESCPLDSFVVHKPTIYSHLLHMLYNDAGKIVGKGYRN